MSQLDGKTAVVTAATTGIALAAVRLFAGEGAHVYAAGHGVGRLEDSLAGVAGDVTAVDCDTTDPAGLARLAEAVRAGSGRADVLYAAAGSGIARVPLAQITADDVESVFALNTRGTLFTVQRLLPLLADGASVIINGSAGAAKGTAGATVYAASKAALRSFARTWAAELADRRIRVSLLSLGVIDLGPGDGVPARSNSSSPRASRPAGSAGPPRSPPLPCSSHPTPPAMSPAPSWPSTAGWPRYDPALLRPAQRARRSSPRRRPRAVARRSRRRPPARPARS